MIFRALPGVCRATWHRLRAAGKLPAPVKLGRALRWRRDEIVAWINANCPDAETWAAMQAAKTAEGCESANAENANAELLGPARQDSEEL